MRSGRAAESGSVANVYVTLGGTVRRGYWLCGAAYSRSSRTACPAWQGDGPGARHA